MRLPPPPNNTDLTMSNPNKQMHVHGRAGSGNTGIQKYDSVGVMVCTANGTRTPPGRNPSPVNGNATTCACQEWGFIQSNKSAGTPSVDYCAVGPGWKPSVRANLCTHANETTQTMLTGHFAGHRYYCTLVRHALGCVGGVESLCYLTSVPCHDLHTDVMR